jgi:GH3 auxin-responsive promoter
MARRPFLLPKRRFGTLNIAARKLLNAARGQRYAQRRTFRSLLQRAADTAFGRHYRFADILSAADPVAAFKKTVPVVDYDGMHPWWARAEKGESDVAWPGVVKYFALSSGTSGAPSKHIPVTRALLRSTRTTSVRQLLALQKFGLSPLALRSKVLTLAGSTTLQDFGHHMKGDVSGINVKQLPWFARTLHKPGQKISAAPDWESRLRLMVEQAPNWDIGTVAGVPAWLDILLERIITTYQLGNIHEIWPNLQVYIHGGVAIHPYREKLQRHFGKPVIFAETYLASEGFFAYQSRPNSQGMELVRNAGIFFEFIPFTDEFFDGDGKLKTQFPRTETLRTAKLGQAYALVISTCAGAWRYLIGDVVKFVSMSPPEIIIDGRTKHFLSLCGEHLSVDNMTQAITQVAKELGLHFPEFGVAGIPYEGRFGHQWYVACNDPKADPARIQAALDAALIAVNDDYAVERKYALAYMGVRVLPGQVFLDYLASLGKAGGQSKFPRVLKGAVLEHWMDFLAKKGS